MKPTVLWIDVETTGLDPQRNVIVELGLHSELRTESFVICDPRMHDEAWRREAVALEAMRVNGITLAEVLEQGITPQAALERLELHQAELAYMSEGKVFWGGHNFGSFDLQFLKALAWRSGQELPRHPHRFYDSATAILLLAEAGVLQPGLTLAQAAAALGFNTEGSHRAGVDARLSCEVWGAAVGLLGSSAVAEAVAEVEAVAAQISGLIVNQKIGLGLGNALIKRLEGAARGLRANSRSEAA